MKTVITFDHGSLEFADVERPNNTRLPKQVTLRMFNRKREQIGIDAVIPVEAIQRLAKGL